MSQEAGLFYNIRFSLKRKVSMSDQEPSLLLRRANLKGALAVRPLFTE